MYPVAILLLALFIAPLPALLAERIAGSGYLLRTLGPGIGLPLIFYLIGRLRQRQHRHWPGPVFRLLLILPVVGGLLRVRRQRNFLASLAILTEGGVPANQALQLAFDSVTVWLTFDSRPVCRAVSHGASLGQVLWPLDLLDDPARQLLMTGDQAGRLEPTLTRLATQADQQLNDRLDTVTEWLPRLVYAAVLGLMLV